MLNDRRSRPIATLLLVAVLAACGAQAGSASQATREGPASDEVARASASTAPATASILPASPSPSASPTPGPTPAQELPTRIVVARLGIDLPIVSGDLDVPGNPPDYPLCGVAQYLTIYRDPGRPGTTTWIYGHARPGMFLPLLEASTVKDGAALVGMEVDLYSDAARRYTYRMTKVLRHATDRSAATDVPPDGRRLIMQTSEGPAGTVPKLQVVAEFSSVTGVEPDEARPAASPIGCYLGP